MTKLLESLNELRLKGLYCDVLVRGGDEKEHAAHRVILAAVSPVFDRELTVHSNVKRPPVILLNGIESELIGMLLDFIYSKDFNKPIMCKKLLNLCKLLEIDAGPSDDKVEEVNVKNKAEVNDQTSLLFNMSNHSQKPKESLTQIKASTLDVIENDDDLKKTLSHSKLPDSMQHHCFLCKQKYSSAGNLKRHYLTVHQKIKPFSCEFCDKSYGQKVTLQIHVKTTHLDDSYDGQNVSHLYSHNNETYSPGNDDNNDKSQGKVGNKSDHRMGFDVLKGSRLNLNSTCHICHKKLSRPSNLKKHLLIHYSYQNNGVIENNNNKSINDNNNNNNNSIDSFDNNNNNDMDTYLDTNNNNNNNSMDNYLGKVENCLDDSSYIKSENIQNGHQRDFLDDDDGVNKEIMDVNTNINNNKSITTNQTNSDISLDTTNDMSFHPHTQTPPNNNNPLNTNIISPLKNLNNSPPTTSRDFTSTPHSLIHTFHPSFHSKPTKRFVCETCGKAFALAEYLKKHCVSVHNTISFSCIECQRNFSTDSLLKRHQRVHEKKWCEGCKEMFEGRRALSSHLRTSSCAHQSLITPHEML